LKAFTCSLIAHKLVCLKKTFFEWNFGKHDRLSYKSCNTIIVYAKKNETDTINMKAYTKIENLS